MRQNDFGGASRTSRTAARTTAGWVTTAMRDGVVDIASSQPRTRVIRVDNRFAAVWGPLRVCQPDREFGGLDAIERITTPAPAVQIRQPRVGFGRQSEQLGGLAGALLRTAERAVHRPQIARGACLPVTQFVEWFVDGESPG